VGGCAQTSSCAFVNIVLDASEQVYEKVGGGGPQSLPGDQTKLREECIGKQRYRSRDGFDKDKGKGQLKLRIRRRHVLVYNEDIKQSVYVFMP
jgi:hypothetical protein